MLNYLGNQLVRVARGWNSYHIGVLSGTFFAPDECRMEEYAPENFAMHKLTRIGSVGHSKALEGGSFLAWNVTPEQRSIAAA